MLSGINHNHRALKIPSRSVPQFPCCIGHLIAKLADERSDYEGGILHPLNLRLAPPLSPQLSLKAVSALVDSAQDRESFPCSVISDAIEDHHD